ncbi:MAG: glycoside hydrolase family 127 protein, partial [Candidatus Krumholzibacteria bacterium]|nr:glycoside hydrolase family 127 protein [Candidatus Krumholzibacteria bacterium]
YSGVTDVASLMHDAALMDASKRVWDNVVSKKLYLTGGIGSRGQGEGFGPNYELPNMTSYCETCASIANVFWNYRLFLNEADSRYYDVLERVLYNGVISGVSLGGDKFFYDNPLESNHTHERAPWFGCACCPGNVTRFMASVPGYVYTATDDAVMVNLFVGNKAEIPMGSDTVRLSQTTDYPWDGKVRIDVDEPPARRFDLMVRVPGWAAGRPVPSDLYHFADSTSEGVVFHLNGKKIEPKIARGYAHIRRRWKKDDALEISIPMPARKVMADGHVEADRGKIAYQRGPLVYCFEDKDNNDGWLFDVFVPEDEAVCQQFEDSLLGGITTLGVDGYRVAVTGADTTVERTPLKAIPYFAWANRGAANMLVWMPEAKANVFTRSGWGKEMEAAASSSMKWVWGLNTGFDPRSSSDVDKIYYYFWESDHSEQWVQYDFKKPVTLSESKVYWLNLDQYDGNYRVPESWSLMVRDAGKRWVPVVTADAYNVELDKYNAVTFKPVKTSAIRMRVKLQKGSLAGILAWKVI